MNKSLFETEFEFKASAKMLYPYISSASGLSQWLADDVKLDEQKNFNFIWEGEDHKAKMVSHRVNQFAKFEFLPKESNDAEDPGYFELKLEKSELTESVFLKVKDYSDFDDQEELKELWDGLVFSLKEMVGG